MREVLLQEIFVVLIRLSNFDNLRTNTDDDCSQLNNNGNTLNENSDNNEYINKLKLNIINLLVKI